ncbi:MAG: autophagy protein Apg9-domain-containing protein [Olpidium bornovanus]|uniref:Autophagy-related protein 9 n=1 Tax=Olpidium bornovanus TaxID=278681 RepID=A0A8H7ZP91_9FUNG|nr:MAG: autophagy protein Apg9-domain-containing protein [Olpidium bornovanus]
MRSSPSSSAHLRSQPQTPEVPGAYARAGVRVPAGGPTAGEQHRRRPHHQPLHPRSYYDGHLREGLEEEADEDSDLEQGHYRPDVRVRSEPDVDGEDEEDVESERGDLLGPPLSLMIEMNPLEADLQRRKRGARPAQQQQQRARHAAGGTGGRFPFRFLDRHPNGDSNAVGAESKVDVLSPVRTSFGRKMQLLLVLVLFAVFWAWQALQIIQKLPELKEMQEFYNVALQISDQDIDTVAWKDVVNRLIAAKELLPAPGVGSSSSAGGGISSQPPPLPSANRLSAHDITNRIMRKENFMVALFNKDLFDLSVPFVPHLRRKQILTRTLEWNLSFCVLGYVFNRHGQIRRKLLKDTKREDLAAGCV